MRQKLVRGKSFIKFQSHINPWIITDVDLFLKGNPHAVVADGNIVK